MYRLSLYIFTIKLFSLYHQIIYAKLNLKIHNPLPYAPEVWYYKDSNDDLIRRVITLRVLLSRVLIFTGIKFHDFREILHPQKVSKPQNHEIKYLPSFRFSFSLIPVYRIPLLKATKLAYVLQHI